MTLHVKHRWSSNVFDLKVTITINVSQFTYILSLKPQVWKFTIGNDLYFYIGIVAHMVVGEITVKKERLMQIFKQLEKQRDIFRNAVTDIPYHLPCAHYSHHIVSPVTAIILWL